MEVRQFDDLKQIYTYLTFCAFPLAFVQVNEVNEQLEEEKRKQLELTTQKSGGGGASGGSKKEWSEAETQVLIKGVNLFPAGTQDR